MESQPKATLALVVANAAVFLATHEIAEVAMLSSGSLRQGALEDWSLFAPYISWSGSAVSGGEWWRIVTGAFVHADLRHIGFNMVVLWLLGRRLEPLIGALRFSGVYAVSLLAGSAGAMAWSPLSPTVGASGAVYGLMGAAFVVEHRSGGSPWRSGLGSLIVINVALSFLMPGVSVGGHLGGLVGGVACGLVIGDLRGAADPALRDPWAPGIELARSGEGRSRRSSVSQWVMLVLLAVIAAAACLVAASTWLPAWQSSPR